MYRYPYGVDYKTNNAQKHLFITFCALSEAKGMNIIMNKNMQNIIIIGFALFASFFGAGNLIFPPSIGIIAGNQWLIALAAFVLSGIILPLCSFLAVSKADGTEESIAKELNLGYHSIKAHLKKGAKLGWCEFDS